MQLGQYFEGVSDFRRSQGLRYSKSQMFGMIVISNLCGHFGGRGVARFTKYNKAVFIAELGLKHAPPSHVSFSTFLNEVDETQMINAFNTWTAQAIPLEKGTKLSGDGKALRSTLTDANGKQQNFQAIVSLFCQQSGLVYALERYHNGKASEMNVVQFLINQLRNMGLTFFLDALHTQKKR